MIDIILSVPLLEPQAIAVAARIAERVGSVLALTDPGFRSVTFHLDGPYLMACLLHRAGYLGAGRPLGVRVSREVFGLTAREAEPHLVGAYDPARSEDDAVQRLIAAWPRPPERAAAEAAARNSLLCVRINDADED